MAPKTISKILEETAKLKNRKEKVDHLKKHESEALKWILMCMYDKARVKWRVPQIAPPYTPSEGMDNEGMIHREIRKLPYLVEGQGGNEMQQFKRESLFIQMLENVNSADAEVLVQMLEQEPYEGIDKGVINEAFPGTVADQRKKK